jgi:hypothetical protein
MWAFKAAQHTLVLSVTTLNLFVHALLDLSLENTGSRRLIKAGCLENMRSIDPIISTSSHHTIAINLELVHRDLREESVTILVRSAANSHRQKNMILDFH